MPVTKISEADALAAHKAIHGGTASVTLSSGQKLPVELNNSECRVVKFAGGVTAAEQNKTKSSDWAAKAKKGVKITWLLTGSSPATWGRIVAGKVETRGAAVAEGAATGSSAAASGSGAASSSGSAGAMKRPAAAAEAGVVEPPAKKLKVVASEAASSAAEPAPEPKTLKTAPVALPVAVAAAPGSDPLGLSGLFAGSGHGAAWEAILRPVIERQPNAEKFIGPSREKRIIPVRELTFQALKPNPPSGWRVVSFGQSPYPRMESATGIAHFDASLNAWDDSRFGSIMTMRCMIKAAAMHKYGIPKNTSTADLRTLLKTKGVVGPPEWFQAMLTQGVLFMNASCTLLPPEDKAERSGKDVDMHRRFWQPALEAIVTAILQDCRDKKRGVVFAWWGAESLKTKKALQSCFNAVAGVSVEHIESPNPAAMGDVFCNEPNVFGNINKALKKFKLASIDWLPSAGWKASLPVASSAGAASADAMGSFIAETQDLHKMYLERLRDGLDISGDELADITGIAAMALVSLPEACKPVKLERAAEASVNQAKAMKCGALTADEAAAVHLYTTNHLYKLLNDALRSRDRQKATKYFSYLRLLLTALDKIPRFSKMLYRGVALDLSSQYKLGTEVTWWAVSSCTPSLKVASSFGGSSQRTLFLINSSRSVGIQEMSQYKDEEEFVLAPGTSFTVEKVIRKGTVNEIHLKELEKPRRVR